MIKLLDLLKEIKVNKPGLTVEFEVRDDGANILYGDVKFIQNENNILSNFGVLENDHINMTLNYHDFTELKALCKKFNINFTAQRTPSITNHITIPIKDLNLKINNPLNEIKVEKPVPVIFHVNDIDNGVQYGDFEFPQVKIITFGSLEDGNIIDMRLSGKDYKTLKPYLNNSGIDFIYDEILMVSIKSVQIDGNDLNLTIKNKEGIDEIKVEKPKPLVRFEPDTKHDGVLQHGDFTLGSINYSFPGSLIGGMINIYVRDKQKSECIKFLENSGIEYEVTNTIRAKNSVSQIIQIGEDDVNLQTIN